LDSAGTATFAHHGHRAMQETGHREGGFKRKSRKWGKEGRRHSSTLVDQKNFAGAGRGPVEAGKIVIKLRCW